MKLLACAMLASALLAGLPVRAQTAQTVRPTVPDASVRAAAATAVNGTSSQGWQACQALVGDAAAQLKCFQDWAAAQTPKNTPPAGIASVPADSITGSPAAQVLLLPALNTEAPDGKPVGCRDDRYSELSRFWELQSGTDCGTFALRGFRPISLAVVTSDSVNSPPGSSAARQPFSRNETKIQLSVRTKVAKGLLKAGPEDDDSLDSLWFAYSQQSYWQIFNKDLSRPFRNTDHEPELIYIYPHQIQLPGGWNYRLSGLGLVHQSNGQSDPLSRSWNRVYLMGAAEKRLGPDSSLTLQGRIWNRLKDGDGIDDNPGIENFVGRAELGASWKVNQTNTLGLTYRHSLRSEARGSTRIDWMVAPKASPTYTGLRYHLQLFSGFGDSLVDYNRKRSVISLGVSLVDW
jgi:phospholipase A1